MRVNEFVEKYNEAEDKDSFIKSVLKEQYVPYEEKISDCKRIVDVTSYTNTDPNMYKKNSPSRKMLFWLTLIDKYTDIDIDFSNALAEYNMLCQCKMDLLFDSFTYRTELPELIVIEVDRYNDVLYDIEDDFEKNERSMIGYLDSKLAAFKIFGESFDKMIEDMSV